MSVHNWIDRVNQTDRALAALLRGVIGILKGETLVFVWTSDYHKAQGIQREEDIRRHLGAYAQRPIQHITHEEFVAQDPVAEEIIRLGGRLRSIG